MRASMEYPPLSLDLISVLTPEDIFPTLVSRAAFNREMDVVSR